jgi:peptidoglycan/LPS O-acetylase OafA/YrhL
MSDAHQSYRHELDGLRAIAVLTVIIHHFSKELLPSGYLGVDFFFVISGYVITRSLLKRGVRAPHSDARSAMLSFYARRVRRLLPALIFCVMITTLCGSLVIDSESLIYLRSLRTGLTALFGLSNLYLYRQATDYFGADSTLNLFTQTWSLGVEEQFYLLFPLLVWWVGVSRVKAQVDRAASVHQLAVVTTILSLFSLSSYLYFVTSSPSSAYFLVTSRLWELGAGCLVAIAEVSPPTARLSLLYRKLSSIPVNAVFLTLCVLLFFPLSYQALATALSVISISVLLIGLRSGTGLYRLLTSKVMVWVGLISYSLYLWHWSVLTIGRWTLGISWETAPLWISLMFGCATISYYWIERPLRHASWAQSELKTICLGLGVCACLMVGILALSSPLKGALYTGDHAWGELLLRKRSTDVPYIKDHCHIAPDERPSLPIPSCVVSSPEPHSPTLYFMGNSHTNHLRALHLELGRALGYNIDGVSQSGCEFPVHSHRRTQCSDFQTKQRDRLIDEAQPGDLVVISNRYIIDNWWSQSRPASWIERPDAIPALNALAERLSPRGVRLVLMLPTPEFPYNVLLCAPQWYRPSPSDMCAVKRAHFLQLRAPIYQRVQRALSPLIARYDPMDALCDQALCSMLDGAQLPLYMDTNHLSRHGALTLAPSMLTWMRAQLNLGQK